MLNCYDDASEKQNAKKNENEQLRKKQEVCYPHGNIFCLIAESWFADSLVFLEVFLLFSCCCIRAS